MESIRELLQRLFKEVKEENREMSLDDVLYEVYERANLEENFDKVRELILSANDINEYEYYTKDVNPELKKYIEENVFPEYEKNDKAHGIIHIREVIRRAFALRETLKLDLDTDMVFAISACHDLENILIMKYMRK